MTASLVLGDLELLATGCAWAEGPLWLPDIGRVRWSDIPNNRILEWDRATGQTTVFRNDAEYTNGRTLDLEGAVVQCSHGRRSVERETADGPVTIVDQFEGHRLNSPNDVVVASDGAIWFTDPPYGIRPSGIEGHPGEQEYGGCYVFRYDERTGELTAVVTDMDHPNGLAFSPDESLLYVADTGDPDVIRVYPVEGPRLGPGRLFATVRPGPSDGFRVDVEGRIWTSSDGFVQVLSPDGDVVERIAVPEKVSNVCFGGPDGTELYVTASTSLYRLRTTTRQAPRPARSA